MRQFVDRQKLLDSPRNEEELLARLRESSVASFQGKAVYHPGSRQVVEVDLPKVARWILSGCGVDNLERAFLRRRIPAILVVAAHGGELWDENADRPIARAELGATKLVRASQAEHDLGILKVHLGHHATLVAFEQASLPIAIGDDESERRSVTQACMESSMLRVDMILNALSVAARSPVSLVAVGHMRTHGDPWLERTEMPQYDNNGPYWLVGPGGLVSRSLLPVHLTARVLDLAESYAERQLKKYRHAISAYRRAAADPAKQEAAIDIATAFEALLMRGEKDSTEIALKLRLRAAYLLAPNNYVDRKTVFDVVNKTYGLRSRLVHTGSPRVSVDELGRLVRAASDLFPRGGGQTPSVPDRSRLGCRGSGSPSHHRREHLGHHRRTLKSHPEV